MLLQSSEIYIGQEPRLSDALNYAHTKSSSAKTIDTLRVELIRQQDPLRHTAERFIKAGFAKAYSADIDVSMPTIIALQKAQFKAALGVRSAQQALFVEQYLSLPIEHALARLGITAKRNEIAEIGHLYSNTSSFTLSLLIVTALVLRKQQYKSMVFTATSQLASLFHKFGLKPTFLAEADPTKLSASPQNWGTYYATAPKVMVLQLDEVEALIQSDRLFKRMADSLQAQIEMMSTHALHVESKAA
jgi:hypothetical protein